MENITPADIRARVEAILAAIPEIKTVITDESCPLTDDDLPAVIVMIRRAERSRTNQSWWMASRTVQIGAMFTRLCGDSVEEQRAQMTAAEALMEVIPDAFERLDRLSLNNQKLAVQTVGEMTDGGLETRPWGEDVMYATTYEFVVTTRRS